MTDGLYPADTGPLGTCELSLKKIVCGDDNQLADHEKPNVVADNFDPRISQIARIRLITLRAVRMLQDLNLWSLPGGDLFEINELNYAT